MLTHNPKTIQFELRSEWVELVIAVGLFLSGVLAGGHFKSVPDLWLHISGSDNPVTLRFAAGMGAVVAWAVYTTSALILLLVYLTFNYWLRQCARFESSVCGKGPWSRLYDQCGMTPNYVGNSWTIGVTRALMITLDPFWGWMCGSAIAAHLPVEPFVWCGAFVVFHCLIVWLRTEHGRRQLKAWEMYHWHADQIMAK